MRTKNGHLELTDQRDNDRRLIIIGDTTGITLLNVNRDADQQAEVRLGADNLDQLAAEILRLREHCGF